MLTLKERIEKEFNVKFNSCLVGKFDSPQNKIGFHSDASSSLGPDPHIASISFGAARKFKIKHKTNKNDKVDMLLENGDLVIMKDGANLNYKHMVPGDPKCSETNYRINLTFRFYTYDEVEMLNPAISFEN
jgi:alkylated DNA repair dioxygenase AlkB